MTNDKLRRQAKDYYTRKLAEYGPIARGADWSTDESQILRFEVLISVAGDEKNYSLLDFGCGYGALLPVLRKKGWLGKYWGFDLSAAMIESARECQKVDTAAVFTSALEDVSVCDYAVASGVFNVKGAATNAEWMDYMHETVQQMASTSRKGFSFNVLTSYSDVEKRRADLYYADPCYWFDFCKRNYGKFVILRHDYPLWEFTLCVKKEA